MPQRKGKHPHNSLSAAFVNTVKQPGRYADGNGLYLRVDPSGRKGWTQKITIHSKRRDLGLGGYPLVSLKEAREKALFNRRLARSGGDPLAEKRKVAVPTFAEAVEQVIALNAPTWRNAKTAALWTARLETYALPQLGDMPVNRITPADVLGVLIPVWTSKRAVAQKLKQYIHSVMDWAVVKGWRQDNPASAVAAVLPRTEGAKSHFDALPYAGVPAALEFIRASTTKPATRLALEFLVLTAARSGEIRAARREEVSLDSRVWTVPAARMKAGREHRVPLSRRALDILEEARSLDDGPGLIFPGRWGRPLSDMTFTALLRRLNIPCVPHGFRSSFRDWAAEQTDAPHAVMEAALAHVVGNSTEAAYFRSDLFERRRTLMIQWADYLCESDV